MAVPTADVTTDVNIFPDRGWTVQPITDTLKLFRHSLVSIVTGELVMADDTAGSSSTRIIEGQFDNEFDGQSAKLWEGDILMEATGGALAAAAGVKLYLEGTITQGVQTVTEVVGNANPAGIKSERISDDATRVWVRVTAEAQAA